MELEFKAQQLPGGFDSTSNQFGREFSATREIAPNINISQTSEGNDDISQTSGHVKTESGPNELDSSKNLAKINIKRFQVPKKWDWLPCNYELKREERGTEIYWNLIPIVQLVNPDSKAPPQIDITIDMERPFMYNSEVGWNWHKSWNLPNITINTKILDPKTKVPLLPPSELKAHLIAAKVLMNRVEQVKLFDLNLKGNNVQDLSDGTCTFTGAKFASTSYNHEGVKFHLILLVYIQEDVRNRICPKILYSRISPPIFVDSRKAARNSQIFKKSKINSVYFSSFPPETFLRTFVKRNSKLNDAKEEAIENNLEGLSHYFTAPNIRNKVKHPVFLSYKFSNCVKFFYNVDLAKKATKKDELKTEDLIYFMQKTFLENHHTKKDKNDLSSISSKAFDNKHFILVIEEPTNDDSFLLNKKIGDYIEPIVNEVLHIVFNSSFLPSHFLQFPMEDLPKAYTTIYPKLLELKDFYGDILIDDDNEEFEEDYGYREDLHTKRDRSELDSDPEQDDFDDTPGENKREKDAEIAQASAPKKKVKTERKKSQPKNVSSTDKEKSASRQTKPKKKPEPTEKKKVEVEEPKIKKENAKIEASSKVESHLFNLMSKEVKMETERFGLKNEEESRENGLKNEEESLEENDQRNMTLFDTNQIKEEIKGEPMVQPPMNNMSMQNGNLAENMKLFMRMQQQQQYQQQQQPRQNMPQNNMMAMMYANANTNTNTNANKNFYEPPAPTTNSSQTQQEQQQRFLELQIMKRQQQLFELQAKLKEMQDKVGITKKDNASPSETTNKLPSKPTEMPARSESYNGAPNNMPNPQFMNQMLFKNQQFMGMRPGMAGSMMGNRPQNFNMPENYFQKLYPGLQMGQGDKNASGMVNSNINAGKSGDRKEIYMNQGGSK